MTTPGPDGIIDTNVVILLPHLGDDSNLPERPAITTLTLAELSVGPLVTDDPIERANRQAHLQQAEADFVPLGFDQAAARAFGRVAADPRRSGRTRSARAYDALIAAVAISNGLPLHTANPDNFIGIDGLEIETVTVRPTPNEALRQAARRRRTELGSALSVIADTDLDDRSAAWR